MLKTSASNINQILEKNKCGSLTELNQKDSVWLELYHLSGHLDLSEFTQGAVKLYIINSVPNDPKWSNMEYRAENKEKLEIANKKADLVTLDAGNAGDFAYWNTDDCRNYHFVKNIILRHPNQVFHFGIRPAFGTQNDSLDKLFQKAKTESIKNNLSKYEKDKSFSEFHYLLSQIIKYKDKILSLENEIGKAIEEINKIETRAHTLNELKETANESINDMISRIIQTNRCSEFKIPAPDIAIIKDYWETETHINNDSGDQVYSYSIINNERLEILKSKNREFYSQKR